MPLAGLALDVRRFTRRSIGAVQEAVIGQHDDRRRRIRRIEQLAEQLVLPDVEALDHLAVARDVGRVDAGQLRRGVVHEAMADLVDALVVDGGQVGLPLADQP